ncbi:DUF6538 domain-containing protein [Brevundimonas sp. S1H14]|uniref:DUF6538 domain-containing protein n=1 Tax=Brevundimonas sp. S1H14 TaxID=3078084 RepID=UPI0039EBC662
MTGLGAKRPSRPRPNSSRDHPRRRASPNHIVENAAELPSAQPFPHDCYTTLLHNLPNDQELNRSDHSGKRRKDCYTKLLHNVRTHLVERGGGRIYYRRRVPDALRGIVGKKEVWKSLGTDSPTVAKRRALRVAAQIEQEFEIARSKVGLIVDPIMLEAFGEPAPLASPPAIVETEASTGITLGDLYDAYMDDPTRDWSPTTRMAYQATKRLMARSNSAKTLSIWNIIRPDGVLVSRPCWWR